MNPTTAGGWKVDTDEYHCQNRTEQFTKCIEDIAFTADEIVSDDSDLNSSDFTIIDFYTDSWNGIAQSVEIGDNVITTNWGSSLDWIDLDSDISYFVCIMDKKLQFVTANPNIVPRSMLTLKQKAGSVSIYLKAIRHEKLNLPDKPCEPSLDYDFANCLERSVVASVGCQPRWRRFSMMKQPLCDTWHLLKQYGDENLRLNHMDRNELYEATNCLMPCTFMEYQESPKTCKSLI